MINLLFITLFLNEQSKAETAYGQNTCPYLSIPGKSKPILCWMCGTKYYIERYASGIKVSYDCCPGYEKSKFIENQCALVERSWKTIINTLKDNGNEQTALALSKNDKLTDLSNNVSDKAYTVFSPHDDKDISTSEIDYTRVSDATDGLVSEGRWYSKDFSNHKLIPTKKGTFIKVTTYSNGMIFLDCKYLVSPDHETINGIIHYIDGALPNTQKYTTVMKRLTAEPDLSSFVSDLPSDLVKKLDTPNSHIWYTVIAPKNDAWRKAVSDIGSPDLKEKYVRSHILGRLICSDTIFSRSHRLGPTLSNDFVTFTRDSNGNVAIIDQCGAQIQIVRKDIMSGTGVIHVIDKPMQIANVMEVKKALRCLGANSAYNVKTATDNILNCDFTIGHEHKTIILLPVDEAMKAYDGDNRFRQMQSDSEYRCQTFAYHILEADKPKYSTPGQYGFIQGQILPTQYTNSEGKKQAIVVRYVRTREGSYLIFNDAKSMLQIPLEFNNGILFPVSSVNFPPTKNIINVLKDEDNTKEIVKKLVSTDFVSEFRPFSPNLLFLATIDMGWKTRNLENSYTISQTKKLLQLHTIPKALVGNDGSFTGRESILYVNSLLKNQNGKPVNLIIKRHPDGNTFIGYEGLNEKLWSMVLKWRNFAIDGNVWIIDWPLKCPDGLR